MVDGGSSSSSSMKSGTSGSGGRAGASGFGGCFANTTVEATASSSGAAGAAGRAGAEGGGTGAGGATRACVGGAAGGAVTTAGGRPPARGARPAWAVRRSGRHRRCATGRGGTAGGATGGATGGDAGGRFGAAGAGCFANRMVGAISPSSSGTAGAVGRAVGAAGGGGNGAQRSGGRRSSGGRLGRIRPGQRRVRDTDHHALWRRARRCRRRGARRGRGGVTGPFAVVAREPLEQQLRNALQRRLDTRALERHRLEVGQVARVQPLVQYRKRQRRRRVALVVLDHLRDLWVDLVHQQVLAQATLALGVGVEHRGLAVGDEHDRVAALQHHPPGGFVEDLAGHGVDLHPRAHAADHAELDRQEVEEQRAVGLRGERHQLALRLEGQVVVDPLQVGGLAAQARPVVDELGRDLLRRVVEERHSPRGVPVAGPLVPAAR